MDNINRWCTLRITSCIWNWIITERMILHMCCHTLFLLPCIILTMQIVALRIHPSKKRLLVWEGMYILWSVYSIALITVRNLVTKQDFSFHYYNLKFWFADLLHFLVIQRLQNYIFGKVLMVFNRVSCLIFIFHSSIDIWTWPELLCRYINAIF